MKMSAAFPSEYLRAVDFEAAPQKLTIAKVAMKDIGDDHKPVLYFQENEKGLVLNKTNSNTLTEAYGDESDGWRGKEIVLFAATTDYQGRQVPCVRVRKPKQPIKQEMEDEIPF